MSGVWDPLNPALDVSPPREGGPAASYLVCSTPRTGSGLLCRGLARTGLAGAPAEYFLPGYRRPLAARWGAGDDVEAYVRALQARRTTENGVFGAKLHWEQLQSVRRERRRANGIELLQAWFPGATYVSIQREDVNRQAASWWTAIHTGVWSAAARMPSHPARVPYSFSGIGWLRESILRDRDAWESSFAQAGVAPVRVTYEELSERFHATVARVAEEAAGVRIEPGAIPGADTRKLADERSEELLRRFERDLAGRRPPAFVGRGRTAFAVKSRNLARRLS